MLTLIKSIYDIQETFHLPIVSPYFFFLPPFHIITFFNTHSLVSPYTTAHGFPFNTLHIYKRQNSFIFFKTPSLFLNFLLLFLTLFFPENLPTLYSCRYASFFSYYLKFLWITSDHLICSLWLLIHVACSFQFCSLYPWIIFHNNFVSFYGHTCV